MSTVLNTYSIIFQIGSNFALLLGMLRFQYCRKPYGNPQIPNVKKVLLYSVVFSYRFFNCFPVVDGIESFHLVDISLIFHLRASIVKYHTFDRRIILAFF